MGDMLKLIWWAVIGLFRSRASLEAEILTLRHQLNVLRRKSPKRATFSTFDRFVFATLYRFAPRVVDALAIVEPETVIRWHSADSRHEHPPFEKRAVDAIAIADDIPSSSLGMADS
jgi:hypothetical protein